MKSNKLISYRENFFTKILNFFKKLFLIEKNIIKKDNIQKNINEKDKKDYFSKNLEINENAEERRLKLLQLQYDNGEIEEEDISDEDMDKLIEMYKKETEELNLDTETRKKHIAQMLKDLKSS